MKKLYKILIGIFLIVVLYAVTMKGLVPFALDVAKSGLFLKETEDDPVGELHSARTYAALLQCENELRDQHGQPPASSPSASESEYKAWGLGDHVYVIKAAMDLPNADNVAVRSNVTCKIQYQGGEQGDASNWSILGVTVDGA